jgi:SAM-dependent methyltransferase
LHLPEPNIETLATPQQLSKMWARIEETWTRLGNIRPHFSVATLREFLPENIDGSIDRFWASGYSEANLIAFVLSKCGFGDLAGKTCVEYGCGMGRVTIPFAERFAEIHAYDISPSLIALAQQRAETMAAGNIRFHRCVGGLPDRLEGCDFFYSRVVFQHNPPPVIRELIELALRSLRPGGIALFGVPTFLSGYNFQIDEYLAQQRGGMEMHCIPQRKVFALIAAAGCRLLELREERDPDKVCLGNLFVVERPA